MIVSIIVAVSENNVIGKDNDLIWHLPDDMKFFKEKTNGHHVLMGRKNYESIPEKYRPLPNRVNLVITRSELQSEDSLHYLHSIQEGIDLAKKNGEDELFIIGGGEIYRQSMNLVDKIYLTRVHSEFDGDTYFSEVNEDEWNEVSREEHDADERHAYNFTFLEYAKK